LQGEISNHKIMNKFKILARDVAEAGGYISLTTPYRESNEIEMEWFSNVLEDMRGCDAVIIDLGNSYEVARHSTELNFDK